MAHVNLLKHFKTGNGWVLKSIPRRPNGQRDWSALPDGSYFIEWREEGKRMRLPAGRTVSQALEAQHIKLAELAATEVGILQRYKPPSHAPEPEPMRLSASIRRYLDQIDTLKKPNTVRRQLLFPVSDNYFSLSTTTTRLAKWHSSPTLVLTGA